MEYLYVLQQALVWVITIFWLYQVVVSICSLVKLKDKPILEDKQNRFMAIIPAHNEEAVVKNLVESLKKQDYPKDLLDIYVIADNCTDRTAEIAKSMGCKVIECKDKFDYARNQYITNASSDWILSVDADERMLSSDLEKLRSYLPTCLSDAVILPNLQYYGDGRWATWYLARIFRKNDRVRFDSPIHGSITKSTEGVLGFFSGAIHHYDGIMGMERRYEKRERNVELIKKQIELEPKRSSNYNYLLAEEVRHLMQ